MKYVFLTTPNDEGISEVFHTVTLLEDLVPAGMVERWNKLEEASPIKAMDVTGKANITPNSTYNPETEEFTAPEGTPEDGTFPADSSLYVFLIDNKVTAVIAKPTLFNGMGYFRLRAGLEDPITIKALDNLSNVYLGYTWDGTNFIAPENS